MIFKFQMPPGVAIHTESGDIPMLVINLPVDLPLDSVACVGEALQRIGYDIERDFRRSAWQSGSTVTTTVSAAGQSPLSSRVTELDADCAEARSTES